MKKTINGAAFNTEKAILIGTAGGGFPGDFKHWEAGLYKTPRSGRYFLAGSGGPMTRFAQSAGQNSWTGGEDLIPMTRVGRGASFSSRTRTRCCAGRSEIGIS